MSTNFTEVVGHISDEGDEEGEIFDNRNSILSSQKDIKLLEDIKERKIKKKRKDKKKKKRHRKNSSCDETNQVMKELNEQNKQQSPDTESRDSVKKKISQGITRTSSEVFKVQFKSRTFIIQPYEPNLKKHTSPGKKNTEESKQGSRISLQVDDPSLPKYGSKVEIISVGNIKTYISVDGKTHIIKHLTAPKELSDSQKSSMQRKVFYKLEKFFRLRRLEKSLLLYDLTKKDPEQKLKSYMSAWEGQKEAPPPQNYEQGTFPGQYGMGYDNYLG